LGISEWIILKMEVCQILYDGVSLKEYKVIKTAIWLIKYTPDLKDKNARRFFEKWITFKGNQRNKKSNSIKSKTPKPQK